MISSQPGLHGTKSLLHMQRARSAPGSIHDASVRAIRNTARVSTLVEPRTDKDVRPIYLGVESLIGFQARVKTRVTNKLHFGSKLMAFGASVHEQREKWLEADEPSRRFRKLFPLNRIRRSWLGSYQPRHVWRRSLVHFQLSRSVIEIAQSRIDEAIGDKDAVRKLLEDQRETDLAETTRIVQLRARATKISVPERRVASEQVTNELAACAAVFKDHHRRSVNEASRLFDHFMRGKLDDNQPSACHLFQRQLADVRRNRLNLASVEAQLSNKDADIAPGRRVSAECDTALSLQHQEWMEEAFLLAASTKREMDQNALRKKRQQKLLGEKEQEATGKDAMLSQTQFAELCKQLAPLLHLPKEVLDLAEVQRLFNVAASGGGSAKNDKASLAACTRTFVPVIEALPLIELRIAEATQHFVDLRWTWNGLPELNKDKDRWEAKVESSLIFVLEVSQLNPAYGVKQWTQVGAPTRQLEARALLGGKLSWEEHLVSRDAACKVSGGPEQYRYRVIAKTRGGVAPPSNIVMHRPKHTRATIGLEFPGPLPPFVRGILDIEDRLRKEETDTGIACVEQYEILINMLGRHIFELSQLFRLFAVAGSAQPRSLFSLSSEQFKGFVSAIGLAPQVVTFRALDAIFVRSQRITSSKFDSAAKQRQEGSGEESACELGFTQYISAILRVAHAAYSGRISGMQAHVDAILERDIMPLHHKITKPELFERFLRSRPAVCVFDEHKLALAGIFDEWCSPEASSRHAYMHTPTMNVSEWLQLITKGGYLSGPAPDSASTGDGSDAAWRPAQLTRVRALRIFAEINLDDVSLDIVETDLVHQVRIDPSFQEEDLFAEIVYAEFCQAVGFLMLFSPQVMGIAASEPERPVADLLDMFLRVDFLPRYSGPRSSGFSPKRAVMKSAASSDALASPAADCDTSKIASDVTGASKPPATDYEWVEAAWRGGRERYAMRQLMHKRASGKHLVKLAREAAPVTKAQAQMENLKV